MTHRASPEAALGSVRKCFGGRVASAAQRVDGWQLPPSLMGTGRSPLCPACCPPPTPPPPATTDAPMCVSDMSGKGEDAVSETAA